VGGEGGLSTRRCLKLIALDGDLFLGLVVHLHEASTAFKCRGLEGERGLATKNAPGPQVEEECIANARSGIAKHGRSFATSSRDARSTQARSCNPDPAGLQYVHTLPNQPRRNTPERDEDKFYHNTSELL